MSDTEVSVVLQPVGDLLVVPVQGPVNRELLDILTTDILAYLETHDPAGIIFDMAGIKVLDLHDFEGLRKLSSTAELMGAESIFAGIQPGVAAGLTMLDADTEWIRTVLNVELAMSMLR